MRGKRMSWRGCIWLVLMMTPVIDLMGWVQPAGQYRLVTDRGVYVAGERVRFRVFNLNPSGIREQGWSTVYYLELISPEGTSLDRTKWPLDGEGASGTLQVPKDLPSGTYYLKGYTKWMRNGGPAGFQYLSLEIINPYRKDLLRVDTVSDSSVALREWPSSDPSGGSVISMPEKTYSRGELISLELEISKGSTSLDCAVSVTMQGASGMQRVSPGSATNLADGGEILPETRGITLSGSVRKDSSGAPAPYAIVYLSSLGVGNEFYATHSDGEGKFYFALTDGSGEREYFISSSLEGMTDLSLRLDQDFSAEPVTLPSFPLAAAEKDPGLVHTLALNAQISEQYRESAPHEEPDTAGSPLWFYGHPDAVVRFRDFIQLPDLEEYFAELIPQVSLRRNGGTRRFLVHGAHPDMQFFPPLVMVDGVAVFDVGSVLEIPPRVVDRVEVITAPYIRGDVTFGGIVHLITRNGNMGYMDLPASGLLLTYKKFAAGSGPVLSAASSVPAFSPVSSGPALPAEPSGTHIPDVRNTLYWDPSVLLLPGEVRTLGFYAPDTPGNYEIRLMGYDPNGNVFEERHIISVE